MEFVGGWMSWVWIEVSFLMSRRAFDRIQHVDDIGLKSGGNPMRQGDSLAHLMQYGLYGSPSLRAAVGQRQVLFAENPPIEARSHIVMNRVSCDLLCDVYV